MKIPVNGYQLTAPLLGGQFSEAEALGAAVWLWMHSEQHRDIPLSVLPTLLLSAIKHQQFVIASRDDKPMFFSVGRGWTKKRNSAISPATGSRCNRRTGPAATACGSATGSRPSAISRHFVASSAARCFPTYVAVRCTTKGRNADNGYCNSVAMTSPNNNSDSGSKTRRWLLNITFSRDNFS